MTPPPPLEKPDPMPGGLALRGGLILGALLAIGLIGAWAFGDVLTLKTLSARGGDLLALRDAHYAATAAGFMAIYLGLVAFSLPGATVATLAGGYLFGVFPGVVFNVMGASLGAMAVFAAVRAGLGRALAARIEAQGGRVARVKAGLDANQWSMLFLIRLLPIVPFVVANLIPALMAVPFRRYAISTVLGILPGALVYTSVGAGLSEVWRLGGEPNLGAIFTAPVLLPILGLCLLSALPILLKLIRREARA